MGKRHPVLALATHADGPAARADGHIHRSPLLQPALSPTQRQVIDALIIPGRIGSLPEQGDAGGHAELVSAVAATGLARNLYRNARDAGLDPLADAATSAANRQRFIGRERWNTAKLAATRIHEATGRPPTALGSLAATHLVYGDPTQRLREELRFLVPASCAAKARLAVADLLGVDVTAHVFPGSSPRSWDEAVRLRGSALVEEGWQLPTLEDAALQTLWILETHAGARTTAALVDFTLLTSDPHFHWGTFVQRSTMWRLRPAAWSALQAMRQRFGARIPPSALRRLEPSPWERILRRVFG